MPLTVLDRNCFLEYRKKYGEIYEDQIRAAGSIVLSKLELYSSADMDRILSEPRSLNPEARIEMRPYGEMPEEWWRRFLETPYQEEGEGAIRIDYRG